MGRLDDRDERREEDRVRGVPLRNPRQLAERAVFEAVMVAALVLVVVSVIGFRFARMRHGAVIAAAPVSIARGTPFTIAERRARILELTQQVVRPGCQDVHQGVEDEGEEGTRAHRTWCLETEDAVSRMGDGGSKAVLEARSGSRATRQEESSSAMSCSGAALPVIMSRSPSQEHPMSFTFRVPLDAPPSVADLKRHLPENVGWIEADPEGHLLELGGDVSLHPYLRGESTRGLQLFQAPDGFSAQVMSCSSPAEFRMARELVAGLAFEGGVPVQVPDVGEETFAPDRLAERFDDPWIQEACQRDAQAVRTLVLERSKEIGTATLSGPRGEFHLGPRLLATLDEGDEATFHERLHDAMRRVHWFDEEETFRANVMQLTSPSGVMFQMVVWAPDVRYFLPLAPYVALWNEVARDMLIIPRERLEDVAGALLTWADERQVFVEATPKALWGKVIERARPHAVDPGGEARPSGGRPWWRFWG